MEDKIEVGDYVRTKYGIAKVEKVEPDKPHKTIWYTVDKPQYYCFLVREQEVIKSSKNIIDLIEEGDYVNEKKVKNTFIDPFTKKRRLGIEGIEVNWQGDRSSMYIESRDIKSIVTKEQYKQIEYIVEE